MNIQLFWRSAGDQDIKVAELTGRARSCGPEREAGKRFQKVGSRGTKKTTENT